MDVFDKNKDGKVSVEEYLGTLRDKFVATGDDLIISMTTNEAFCWNISGHEMATK